MKVILCHGIFDLLHLGHVEHFRQASYYGDRLVVSVLADDFLPDYKKPSIYKEADRMGMVAAIRYVDQAILCKAPGPQEILATLKPDIYIRGSDYEGKEMPESQLLRELGIEVKYTKSLPIRTGDIIKRLAA
jgi:cytidyltransferase-like protein